MDGVADSYVRNDLMSSTASCLTLSDCVKIIDEYKIKVDAEAQDLNESKMRRDPADPFKKDEVDEALGKVDELERKVE
jgi:hypothetical protein